MLEVAVDDDARQRARPDRATLVLAGMAAEGTSATGRAPPLRAKSRGDAGGGAVLGLMSETIVLRTHTYMYYEPPWARGSG